MGAGRPYIVLVNDAKPPNFLGKLSIPKCRDLSAAGKDA